MPKNSILISPPCSQGWWETFKHMKPVLRIDKFVARIHQCGPYGYGDSALEAFHDLIDKLHGEIDKLTTFMQDEDGAESPLDFVPRKYVPKTGDKQMSCTIKAKNEAVKWMPNSSGWQLCGQINVVAGVPVYFESLRDSIADPLFVRPVDRATNKQAKRWAASIRMKFFESVMRKMRLDILKRDAKGLYDKDIPDSEILDYIKQYAEFLENCGGYKVL